MSLSCNLCINLTLQWLRLFFSFSSPYQIPVDLHDKDFLPILQEEPLPPLALVAFTEEEQVGAFTVHI